VRKALHISCKDFPKSLLTNSKQIKLKTFATTPLSLQDKKKNESFLKRSATVPYPKKDEQDNDSVFLHTVHER